MSKPYLLTPPAGPVAEAEYSLMTRPPRIAVRMVLILSSLVVGLLILAGQTNVPQAIRAPGSIMPQGHFIAIESMEGGIVEAVSAQDGDRVEAGDPLVSLQNPNLNREFAILSEQITAAEQSLANADAILAVFDNGGVPKLADVLRLRAANLDTASSTLQIFVESQRIQDGTIAQQRTTVGHLIDALDFAEDRVRRQEELVAQQADLFERGILVKSEYISEVRQLDQLLASSAEAAIRLAEARNGLSLAQANQEQERLALLQGTLNERQTIRQRLAELEASIAIVTARLDNLQLTAPFDGVVQATVFSHPGAVIEPGETLFELLPIRQALVVDIRIPGDDIGQVKEGQEVALSIDTFNVRQFGRAQGRVIAVAPASFTDERTGEVYFRASVELESLVVGEGAFERHLQAGMTAVAEISSGEQTLLAAFLGPIHRTISAAFSESI